MPKKSVLIVETTCSPESPSSPEDINDPLYRHRTSSFKRAIERGPSGDSSNQSFETCDPASTSPDDLTPDKPDLPPYPYPPPIIKDRSPSGTHTHSQKDFQHHSSDYTHSYSSHLVIPDYEATVAHVHSPADYTPPVTGKYTSDLTPGESVFVDNTWTGISDGDKPSGKDVYYLEELPSRFKGTSAPDQGSVETSDNNETSTLDVK